MGALPFRAEHQVAWVVAGAVALLSALITSYQVFMHIRYNSQPAQRRYIIRIILMVPIYALESWLGLRFAEIALYFDLLRECYEAFVIYSFYQLLVTSLGGERALVSLLSSKSDLPHVFPFCYLPTWRMSDRFQIRFSDEEVARLQAAVEQRSRERAASMQSASPPAAVSGAIGQLLDERKQQDLELGRSAPASSSSSTAIVASATTTATQQSGLGNGVTVLTSVVAPHTETNPSPDFSAAASSADMLRGPHSAPLAKPPQMPRIPATYLSPYSRPHHSEFLTHTQLGTLQYCIAKPLTALLAFVLSTLDLYGDSDFDMTRGYPYIAFVTNMSQIWAMYCLVLFYMSVRNELAPLRPIPKFLCVKAVVFFTFWQGVLLAVLASWGVLHATTHYTQAEIVVALQDFIVCLEMLFAALAHHYAFSWKQWHDPALLAARGHAPMLPALLEALNVTDVYVQDVRRVTTRSLKPGSRANPQLSREEIHERQYASFVAAQGQDADPVGALLGDSASESLQEPLNPAGASDDSASESSTYTSPSAHAFASAHPAPLLSSKSFARILYEKDTDSVLERAPDGHVQASTTRVTERVKLESPGENSSAEVLQLGPDVLQPAVPVQDIEQALSAAEATQSDDEALL